jgi:hypothetical protein
MSEEEEDELEDQQTRDKNRNAEEVKDDDIEYANMPSLSELNDEKTLNQAARNEDDENVLGVSAAEETVVTSNRTAEHGLHKRLFSSFYLIVRYFKCKEVGRKSSPSDEGRAANAVR